MMWGLVGKDESNGAEGSEASPGFEGLSVLASWMARTAYTNSIPPSSFYSVHSFG